MKTFELKGEIRTDFGKSAANSLRKEKLVPCNLYGGKESENINFTVDYTDILKLIYTPYVYIVDLTIDGKNVKSILKEIQFHPVKDEVIHLDFLRIDKDVPVEIEIPVRLVGVAPGVKAGGKQYLEMRRLKVRGLYENFPETINIDVSKLKLGDSIQVGELDFDNLEFLNQKEAVVCRVQTARIIADAILDEEEAEAEEREEEAAAEGEEGAAEGEEGTEGTTEE